MSGHKTLGGLKSFLEDGAEFWAVRKSQHPPVPPHPMKYPQHEFHKGEVFNGRCNRTACNSPAATFFNIETRGYYCVPCARGINGRDPKPLCHPVDHDLTHEEMDQMHKELTPWP